MVYVETHAGIDIWSQGDDLIDLCLVILDPSNDSRPHVERQLSDMRAVIDHIHAKGDSNA